MASRAVQKAIGFSLDAEPLRVRGFPVSAIDPKAAVELDWDTTTLCYSHLQKAGNVRVARDFIQPIARRYDANVVLDVGCGNGTAVATFLEDGFDAYGIDLVCLAPYWEELERPKDRFCVVEPDRHRLPFEDSAVDFAFSFGVIEHVGTVDGHSERLADYHERREGWLREIMRVVRPGGHVLIGCPNRGFPLDFSHDLEDTRAAWEHWLSRKAGVSIHHPWGENFLPGYPDVRRYLRDEDCDIEPLSIHGLLEYGRVPRLFRPFARWYVEHLPKALLGGKANPWVMALIQKHGG